MPAVIRKIIVTVEETRRDAGRDVSPATRKAAAIAVIENPCARKPFDDLSPPIAIAEAMGGLLTHPFSQCHNV